MTSTVEIVIAVHRTDRPVGRAAASVLEGADEGIRPVVVGHGLDVDVVSGLLPETVRRRARVLSHVDGIPAPGGPFNAGLDASEATYVGVMGSDDTVQPGAVAAWRAVADRHDSDAVIARVEHSTGGLLRTPPIRPLRWGGGDLDLARDRLAYRTAPLGIMRTAALRAHGLRLTENVVTGEDIAMSTLLWSLGRHLRYASQAPAYVIGHGEAERITTTDRPAGDTLAPVRMFIGGPDVARMPAPHQLAVVVKLIRIHLFGAVAYARTPFSADDRATFATVAEELLSVAPNALECLSRAETRLLEALVNPQAPAEEVAAASTARRRHGHPATVLTPSLRRALHPQAPLRLMAASALMR